MKTLWISVIVMTLWGAIPAVVHGEEPAPVLAVMDFEAKNMEASAGSIVADFVRDAAVASGKAQVLERSQVAEVLNEQGFQQTGCVAEECAVQMGRLLAARYVVLGSVSGLGNVKYISLRLVDVASGKVIQTATGKTKSLDSAYDVAVGSVRTLLRPVGRQDTWEAPKFNLGLSGAKNPTWKGRGYVGLAIAASAAIISAVAHNVSQGDYDQAYEAETLYDAATNPTDAARYRADVERYLASGNGFNVLGNVMLGLGTTMGAVSVPVLVVNW